MPFEFAAMKCTLLVSIVQILLDRKVSELLNKDEQRGAIAMGSDAP